MDIFATFATDEFAEDHGAKVPLAEGTYLLVARATNPKYQAALGREADANRMTLDLGGAQAEACADSILVRVMAETLLVGWEGVEYKGQPIDYSKANAEKLLQHREFRQFVMLQADTRANYAAKLEDDQGKA